MRRRQLFEICDLRVCPALLRQAVAELIQAHTASAFMSVAPQIDDLLLRSGAQQILDLGSGAGGPWPELSSEMAAAVQVVLTDKAPNPGSNTLRVDARRVPANLTGLRTLFNVFHHFDNQDARAVLADAVQDHQPILIVEIVERRWPKLLGTILLPMATWVTAPALWARSWSKLLLTFVLPIIPVIYTWDAFVSHLRARSPDELMALTTGIGGDRWAWRVVTLDHAETGLVLTCFTGRPL